MRSIVLVLSLIVSIAPVAQAAPAPTDPELWDALVDLNRRHRLVKVDETMKRPAAVVYGSLLVSYLGLMVIPDTFARTQKAAVAAFVGSGAAFAAFLPVAGYWVLVDHRWFKKGERHFERRDPDHVTPAMFRSLSTFLSAELPEQYRVAAGDADLRDYLIQLDQWVRTGVTKGTPPVRPANLR